MLPHKHALISATIGAAGWRATSKPAAFGAALVTGVMPDIDHLIDYWYYRRRGEHRIILPLHGYEFALLGTVFALREGNKIPGIAVLSYLIHLLVDQFENRTHRMGYSLLFRAWYRFRVERISTVPDAAMRGRMEDMNLLKNLARHWPNRGIRPGACEIIGTPHTRRQTCHALKRWLQGTLAKIDHPRSKSWLYR